MKQLINKIGIITLALLALVACDNSEYDSDHLFPEEYHRIASIQDDPTGEITLYESGDDAQMTFSILRTGSDPSLSASIGIESWTQEELEKYNSTYQLIDPSLYSVAQTVSFDSEERYKKVEVIFTAENIIKLKTMIESSQAGKDYYIALKIKDIGQGTVYDQKNYILRKVIVTKPTVQITASTESKEDSPTWIDISTNPEISFSLKLSIANNWDFNCRLVYNPDLVDTYNARYGTTFDPLPSLDNIMIENADVEFSKGDDHGNKLPTLKMNNPDFNGAGLYLVPIEVQSENFLSEVYYVVLENKVALRKNMLYAPFTVTYDGSWWQGLLDDDPNSYWHSPWKDPKYYDNVYGHWFQVKFDEPLQYGVRIKYWSRNYNPVLPIEIKIYTSSDNGNTWTVAGPSEDLCGVSSSWLSPAYEVSGSPITHLRFCVLKTNNGRCGIDSGACTAVAGFRVWGK